MGNIRDEIRYILEHNLVLEFKDHDALTNPDKFNAVLKVISNKIDNIIDLIMDSVRNHTLN